MTSIRRFPLVLPRVALWIILLIACGLPLAWLITQLITRPHLWLDAIPDAFRLKLIARTFFFNAIAASLATAIALPVGLTLGLGVRWAKWLWWIMPVPLLMPSLVITYGWKQAVGMAGVDPMPQSWLDVARCIVALSTWLWPVPAMAIAFALSRIDANLMMHARLDGAVGRTVARLLAAPIFIGWLAAMLLALQEFAVFEPTGISVIATEVRFVFETGASLDQSWSMLPDHAHGAGPTQDERMGAALAVMLPGLTAMITLVLVSWWTARALDESTDWNDASARSQVRVPTIVPIAAILLAFAALGVPLIAMMLTRRTKFEPLKIVDVFGPQLLGSITLGSISATIGTACVILASVIRPSRKMLGLTIAAFLVGGQWAAIALITVFNRGWPWTEIYDSPAMPVIAYTSRFAWIALFAAAATWSPGVRWLRELAATDGADRWQTWSEVVLPIAWPLLAGAIVLIFTLSLTEVPATTLLQPANTLVPMLMTWAHILNYDAMIDASLLLACVVMVAAVGVVSLVRLAAKFSR